MNARQFVNSAICVTLDRFPGFKATLFLFPKFFFPDFLRGVKIREVNNPFALAVTIYFIVFFLVFLMQGLMANQHNAFFFPENFKHSCFNNVECLNYFLGDYANLLNYTVLVEAYCISGCFFLIYTNNIENYLRSSEPIGHLDYSETESSFLGSAFSILFVLTFVLLGFCGYAMEIQSYPPHWYMNTPQGPATFSGYYYLFVNLILLLFVAFVGIAHLGMFKTASSISKGLHAVRNSDNLDSLKAWIDDNKVKKWFAPFASQVLISKIFVLSIILNMTSWKMWEPNVGIMNTIAIVIMVIAGVWFVTLPRYYIQYQLFEIRKKCEVLEYKDIRTPWILGASAVVDIILIAIVTDLLLNREAIFKLIGLNK